MSVTLGLMASFTIIMLPKCWHYAVDWVSIIDQLVLSSWIYLHRRFVCFSLIWSRSISSWPVWAEQLTILLRTGNGSILHDFRYSFVPLYGSRLLILFKLTICSGSTCGISDIVVLPDIKLKCIVTRSTDMVDPNEAHHEVIQL